MLVYNNRARRISGTEYYVCEKCGRKLTGKGGANDGDWLVEVNGEDSTSDDGTCDECGAIIATDVPE